MFLWTLARGTTQLESLKRLRSGTEWSKYLQNCFDIKKLEPPRDFEEVSIEVREVASKDRFNFSIER